MQNGKQYWHDNELENLIWIAKRALGLCVGFSCVYWLDVFLKYTWNSGPTIFGGSVLWVRGLSYAIGPIIGAALVPLVLDLCTFFGLRAIVRIAATGFFIGLPVGFLAGGVVYLKLEIFWEADTRTSGWIGTHADRGIFLCTLLGAMLGVIVAVWIYVWRISRMRLETEDMDLKSGSLHFPPPTQQEQQP
jgi:hypothetical protein